MNFCSSCGAAVTVKVPDGDHLPRFICTRCDTIHYQNPKIVAGCIVEWQDKILICRRAIEPRHGLWTLPAGFMENGETTMEAAARETREEACAPVEKLELYSMYSLPHINQVYIIFRGFSPSGLAAPGPESLEVAFVDEQNIPWEELAFPVITETLEHYVKDRHLPSLPTRIGDIVRLEDRSLKIARY